MALTIQQLQERLIPVLEKNGVNRAVLFGSYAKGAASDNSDIDLLVDSNMHGLRFVGLLDEIRRAVGMEVDLFDVAHIEPNSLIDSEIRTTGVVVYEK